MPAGTRSGLQCVGATGSTDPAPGGPEPLTPHRSGPQGSPSAQPAAEGVLAAGARYGATARRDAMVAGGRSGVAGPAALDPLGGSAAQLEARVPSWPRTPIKRPPPRRGSTFPMERAISVSLRPEFLHQDGKGFAQLEPVAGGVCEEESALSNKASILELSSESRLFSSCICAISRSSRFVRCSLSRSLCSWCFVRCSMS